jgi:predicted acetyltransferase
MDLHNRVSIGPATSEEDLLQHARLAQNAFHDRPSPNPDIADLLATESERVRRFIRVDGQVVGGLSFTPTGQWFGGRRVPTAAIGAVVISPEYRSYGLGSLLIADLLRQCRDHGLALSTLYPASQGVYRKAGYENAGVNVGFRVPIAAFTQARRDPDLTVRRVTDADQPALRELQVWSAQRNPGNLDRPEQFWRWKLESKDTAIEKFLVVRGDEPTGYVIFHHRRAGSRPRNTSIHDLVAKDRSTARTIIALIGAHAGNVETVSWAGGPTDPLFLDLLNPGNPEQAPDEYTIWMSRIVDLPGALTARGYAPHVSTELQLEMDDHLVVENSGRWRVIINDGAATVERGGEGRIKVTPRGLVPVYTGYQSPFAVRDSGLLEAPDEDLAAMAGVFAGPVPWLSDSF